MLRTKSMIMFWQKRAMQGLLGALVQIFGISHAMADNGPIYQIIDTPAPLREVGAELRAYDASLVAYVQVETQSWRGAANRAFDPLAGYIFGGNEDGLRIGMTSPVSTTRQDDVWQVRFFMPNSYQKSDLPEPMSPYVALAEVPAAPYAAIRFNGPANGGRAEAHFAKHEAKLRAALDDAGLSSTGAAHYAVYNGPWTPDIMRRNEVLIALP